MSPDLDHDTNKRLREIWRSMKKRCENPSCKDYPHYGMRGIKVCDEWQDFDRFAAWALANGYRKDLTLDRANNNTGYRPDNCRWISRKKQAHNRTTNKFYTIDGKTKPLWMWCLEYDMTPDVFLHRLDRGWSVKDAMMTPKNEKRKGPDGPE